GGEQWLTVPVLRNFPQLIKDVCINNVTDWRASHWKAITYNYQKSGYLEKYKTLFENIYMNRWEKLRDLNIEFIRAICLCLGLKKKFMYSSELAATGEKVERLINICKKVNADTYLSPAGSYDYIEENNMFKDSGINLIYHDYSFSTYRQLYGEFISHLSVIDLLFNEGDKALEVIRSNRKN
ncbi:MAG: WbqC family protein, partial [Candidatus Omnitrophica bacterium]|nr:WbqC family protein [Candidatus Omnitrophota bacterium]